MSATALPRSDQRSPPRARRGRARRVLIPLLVLLLAGGGLAWAKGWIGGRKEAPPGPPPPVPVTLATAEARDMPELVTGLGAVRAFNDVTIRARVDGAIQRIAFQEGKDVKEGDLLVQIDPRPYQAQLASAQAQLAKDQAQLANAERDYERYAELARSQFAARQQVDNQAAQVAQFRAATAADQAQIDLATTQLSYTTITAPISGRLGVRQVDQGNLVQASGNTPIVTIAQLQPISVLFAIPQDSLEGLQRAMAATPDPLQVQVFGRDPGRALATGHLALVNNTVDQATGTVQVKATFDNDDHILWPGESVTASVQLSIRKGAATAPAAAVQRGPDGPYVYVVGGDNKAQMRRVTLAFTRGDTAVFESGLAAGERVVIDGAFKLRNGSAVKPAGENRPNDDQPAGRQPS